MYSQSIDSLFVVLESTMENRAVFDKEKELHIDNLKELLKDRNLTLQEEYEINNNIIHEYEAYSFDAALLFIEKNLIIAKNLKNQYYIDEAQLNLSKLLASSGRNKEAVDVMRDIARSNLSDKLLTEYYGNYRKAFLGLSYYSIFKENKNKYTSYYKSYTDSLMSQLQARSEEYLAIAETKLRDDRKLKESLKLNSRRLAMTKLGSRTYALVTFERALSYELQSDVIQQKRFLILSAISDIQSSVKDNASLTSLAMLLLKENDVNRAHNYINFSFEDAEFYNSRLRIVLISNILPVITKAYDEMSKRQNKELQNLLYVISLLGVILLFTLFFIFRQVKRLSSAKKELILANKQLFDLNTTLNKTNSQLENLYSELSESSLVKEHYIGMFLTIHSSYIDKLDGYRKMVKKHIVAKKIVDLFDKTKSNQLITEELKLFYKNFDDTFLDIFPNFVTKINNLLIDEGKLVPKNSGFLNTELRIFALIRLGITDSSKIAKLLRYSVNTIYNYRVKVKNNSLVPRDNFEDEVMKIGASKK
tara:strand:- start:10712 stop:12313 length:1602 start_codon:yes stop_codon:yes gene_type:complete